MRLRRRIRREVAPVDGKFVDVRERRPVLVRRGGKLILPLIDGVLLIPGQAIGSFM
jgi:hypothetical protein